LIRSYQSWKGTSYVPALTHSALKWSVNDPLPLLPVVTDAPWQIIDKKKKQKKDVQAETEVKQQVFSLDLLQPKEVCLLSQAKSENLKMMRFECKH
jgi:hypothetical protein